MTSRTSCRPVGVVLVRREDAEVAVSCCASSRRAGNVPSTRVASTAPVPGAGRPRRRSRGSRAWRGRAAAAPPLACGFALIRRSPTGCSVRDLRHRRPVGVEELLRPVDCAATPPAPRGAPRRPGHRRTAPGGERQEPSTGLPSTFFGPVQPLGERRTIIGQVGAAAGLPRLREPRLDLARSRPGSGRGCRRTAGAWSPGRRPRRGTAVPVAAHQRQELLGGDAGQHRRVGDLVAVEVQDRQHGAVADRVDELVRVPAGGQRPGLGLAVPDHAATTRSGLSNAAP